jgi:hypothetical protein
LKVCSHFLWLVSLLAVLNQTAQATPAEYLNFDPAARPSGMGSAFTGLADDANAPLFNPAGLAMMGLNLFEARASVGFLTQGRLNDFLSVCQQLPPDDYLGFYFNHYQVDNILGSDINGLPTANLQDVQLAFGSTYAHDFGYYFKVGVSASFIYQNLAETNARGFGGIDVGILYVPLLMEDLAIGASARHLGGFLSWDGSATQGLVPDLRVGLSQKFLDQTLTIAYDAEWMTNSNLNIIHHLGGEILPWKFIAFRMGLDNANPTFGAMVKYLDYSLDYSYEIEADGLGDSQRLSAGLFF